MCIQYRRVEGYCAMCWPKTCVPDSGNISRITATVRAMLKCIHDRIARLHMAVHWAVTPRGIL